MDPFEEFEFKPLTDGLGFHKKKQAPPAAKKSSAYDDFQPVLKDTGLNIIDDLPTVDPLKSPLPRKSDLLPEAPESLTALDMPDSNSTAAAVDEILKTLQKNRRLDKEAAEKAKITAAAPAKIQYKESNINLSASFLDAMLVMAGSLLCMIILLVITKVDIIKNLKNPDEQYMIYFASFALLAGVTFIYQVVNRVFAHCTPGEWAYDQRIGLPEDSEKASYTFKVIARSLLVIATGFVLLPLLSFLFQKDLAGTITGTKLFKRM